MYSSGRVRISFNPIPKFDDFSPQSPDYQKKSLKLCLNVKQLSVFTILLNF